MKNNYSSIRLLSAISVSILLTGCFSSQQWRPVDPLAMNSIDEPIPCLVKTKGSIYQQGSDTYLYGNSRAHRVGDLLTVHVDENLYAHGDTSSDTSRKSEVKDSIALTKVINSGSLDINGENKYSGSGKSSQSNKVTGDITATVIRKLANGNLVIRGYKTLTLSNGVEKIGISGIVREEDIKSEDNSVKSSMIANEHIAYFGRGDLSESSKKGWLSRLFSGSLWPV